MNVSVAALVREAAEKYGSKTAYKDTVRSLSFSEADALSASVASWIACQGMFGKPVLVLTDKSVYTPAVLLGVARAGCFYIPADASQNIYRLRQITESSAADLMIVPGSAMDTAAKLGFEGRIVAREEVMDSGISEELLKKTESSLAPDMPLYVIFTSGSTGRPKGVLTSVSSLINYIYAVNEVLKLNESDILGNQSPLDYIAAVRDIYLPLYTGAADVLIPASYFSMAKDLADVLDREGVTVLCWSAAAMELCLKLGLFEELKTRNIREVLFSGSVLPGKALRAWQEEFPEAAFINQYGPTEATASCTYYIVKEKADELTVLPIGVPYKNYGILLLNEDGTEAKQGETGEICVTGAGVTMGYYRNEELTRKSFIQNPKSGKKDIIYRTGDLGRYNEDGLLEFCGRMDRQIKLMGHRVEPEEIEICAMSVDGVEECAAVYDADRTLLFLFYAGSADKRTVALTLREKLPPFMVPGRIRNIECLPRLSSGKTDTGKLLETAKGSI